MRETVTLLGSDKSVENASTFVRHFCSIVPQLRPQLLMDVMDAL